MKKKIFLMTTILTATAALFLSSCLKDKSHYVNFNTGETLVDFPLGGFVNFSTDAITEAAPDSINGQPNTNEAITRQFAVNVASANLTTAPTNITLAVGGASDVATINQLQSSVVFVMMPANAYKFTTTKVTIPTGQLFYTTSVTFYKALLDPAVSYVLPIYIVSADNGAKLTSNLNIHYFHFIGNDFAGPYEHYFTRWNVPDTSSTANITSGDNHADEGPDTFFPVTGTEFTVVTDYYNYIPYDVSFSKTGTGATAMYSNWTIQFRAADIANYWTPNGISLGAGPFFDPNAKYFLPAVFDPTASYTYAQSLKIFRFYYTTATRAVIDEYVKQ